MGQNFLKDSSDSRDYKLNYSNKIPLPTWIDLRTNASCPDVLNQGNLNTSTVNAISNAIRFWLRKENKPEYQPSRLYMYYYAKQIDNNKDKGVRLRDVMKSIKKFGICSEKNWSYDENKIGIEPDVNIIKEYSLNFKYYSIKNKTKELKQALSFGYPIVFMMSVFENFNNEDVKTTGIVPLPKKRKHPIEFIAVCMYGFRESSDMFICMNSVGKEWGERGFFYLPFKYVEKYCYDFWAITW